MLAASGSLAAILLSETYSTTPIGSGSLVAPEVFAVHTNGGNYAAAMVTAVSSGSITLEYLTYTASGTKLQGGTVSLGGTAGPLIAALVNNYSNVNPNAPNYGIAPGMVMVIWGSNMAAPGTAAVPSGSTLPLTLGGTGVSVTVNGKTVQPALYYVSPTQIDTVLPSTTPVGTGTVTVSYNSQTSPAFPITVVPSAFGFALNGSAAADVEDAVTYQTITPGNSAKPGEILTFVGTGLGADTNNTDAAPNTHYGGPYNITAFYIGNSPVPTSDILYQGRSSYQGQDQINVTVPANAPTGCAVSVVAVSGGVVSNFVSIPIAASGGTCVDPLSYYSPSLAGTLSGKTTVNFGSVMIGQATESTAEIDDKAIASFDSIGGGQLAGYQTSTQPSLGSCFVTQSNSSTSTNPFAMTGLDAGALSVQGPVGTDPLESVETGTYTAQLPAGFIPPLGGSFVFTGSGGPGVGPFTATAAVNLAGPLVWTNSTSVGTIARSSGVTITWNGGLNGTFVQISGYSSAGGFSSSFVCDAPIGAHAFTVPAPVLLALPAGTGELMVSNYTNPASIAIPNLDFAYAMGYASTSIDATYN